MFYYPDFELKNETDKPAHPTTSDATFAFSSLAELTGSIVVHIRAIAKEIGCKPTDMNFEVTDFSTELPERKRKARAFSIAISGKQAERLRGVTAVIRVLVYDVMTNVKGSYRGLTG